MAEHDDNEKTDDEVFSEFFDRLGPEKVKKWIKETLAETSSTPSTDPKPSNPPQTTGGLAEFLGLENKELKADNRTLRDALDKIKDILTPEQRAEMRALAAPPKKEDAGDPPQPPKKKKSSDSNENEPPKPPQGMRKLLARL